MDGFFTALSQHTFLQIAVATALLASIGCGVMGTYVVVKRIAFISRYVSRVACVNRTLVCHRTDAVAGAVIQELYGEHVRMIAHSH